MIGLPWAVALRGLQVVEVELASFVGDGGDRDDAWSVGRLGGCLLEGGHQQSSQGEVAEDVGAELQLEAVGGLGALGGVMTPALLMRICSGRCFASSCSAKLRTEASDARSTMASSVLCALGESASRRAMAASRVFDHGRP